MPPLDDDVIDFGSLTDLLCAAAIRSGDMLELDRLADLLPADRALHVAKVINQAQKADPWIAKVLERTKAVNTIRAEFMRRRSQP